MIYDVGSLINAQRQLHAWRTKFSLWEVQRENNRQDLLEKNIPEDEIKNDDIAPTQTKCCCCKSRVNEVEIQENIDRYVAVINDYYKNLGVNYGKQLNIGKAFVIFKRQGDIRYLDDKYDQSVAGKIWYFIVAKICCRKTLGYPEY